MHGASFLCVDGEQRSDACPETAANSFTYYYGPWCQPLGWTASLKTKAPIGWAKPVQ
jgi:hypothetical protein